MGRVLKATKTAIWFTAMAVVIVAGIEAVIYIPFHGAAKAGSSVNPADFITIILAAVSVILTALAIILAVAGVVGYTQIKDQAVAAAVDAAVKAAADRVDVVLPPQVLSILRQRDTLPNKADSDAIARAQSEVKDEEGRL